MNIKFVKIYNYFIYNKYMQFVWKTTYLNSSTLKKCAEIQIFTKNPTDGRGHEHAREAFKSKIDHWNQFFGPKNVKNEYNHDYVL